MRLVPVKKLKEDSEIAINIIDSNGRLMLKEGQKITPKGVEILDNLGISYVYINDEYCFNNKQSKYTMKIDNLYKSIIELEKIANEVIRGEAGSNNICGNHVCNIRGKNEAEKGEINKTLYSCIIKRYSISVIEG